MDSKSQRLKQLIDDLVEASKISSGNISIQMETINFEDEDLEFSEIDDEDFIEMSEETEEMEDDRAHRGDMRGGKSRYGRPQGRRYLE